MDNLCGTVDAMAWGKEPSTGTSGPFKIIYSGKVSIVTAAKFRRMLFWRHFIVLPKMKKVKAN